MAIKISPAQAILKLLQHYRSIENKQKELNTLYKLYLDGTINPDWRARLNHFFELHKNDILKPFEIIRTPAVIDNDPTKRYFETHLAFETLKSTSKKIPFERLKYLAGSLQDTLYWYDRPFYEDCERVFSGDNLGGTDELCKEYAEFFNRINQGKLFTNEQGFSKDDREKIRLVLSSCFLSVTCCLSEKISPLLPLNVYMKDEHCDGLFGTERGKILKTPSDVGLSQHYGLIKGNMPLSRCDDASSDGNTFDFVKSSETTKYDEKALWIKNNFYQLVHPFSNSLSGTLLSLIRNICYLQNDYKLFTVTDSKEIFDDFIKLVASTMIFFSGGHSLNELISVLQLPEIGNELQDKHALNHLNLSGKFISDVFWKGNNEAFENALQKTITYNDQYIKRLQINAEIHKDLKPSTHRANNSLDKKKENISMSSSSLFLKKRKLSKEDMAQIQKYHKPNKA